MYTAHLRMGQGPKVPEPPAFQPQNGHGTFGVAFTIETTSYDQLLAHWPTLSHVHCEDHHFKLGFPRTQL